MLPLLRDMKARLRPNHAYIEDRAGDGALVGIARDEEERALGVELVVAMRVEVEDDEDGDPAYALVQLYLDPEVARGMALQLTKTSIFVEEEIKGGGTHED
jgi:hypothetical protein